MANFNVALICIVLLSAAQGIPAKNLYRQVHQIQNQKQ